MTNEIQIQSRNVNHIDHCAICQDVIPMAMPNAFFLPNGNEIVCRECVEAKHGRLIAGFLDDVNYADNWAPHLKDELSTGKNALGDNE